MGKNTQQKTTPKLKFKSPVEREFSSGGVVFKKEKGQVLWLVTASAPSKLYPKIVWRLPKGWIDNTTPDTPGSMASGQIKADEESLIRAALREVSEEGGVKAKIVEKIGSEKYFFNTHDNRKILKFVTFYLMKWKKDLPEGHDHETSEVVWLSYEEAYKKLSFPGERQVLQKADQMLRNLPL